MITGEQVKLPKGTIEHLIVQVKDRLQNIDSLETLSPKFDVRRQGADTYFSQGLVATAFGTTLYCLIDTTLADYTPPGYFELFVYFDNLPEVPRLGPFEFEVND